MANPVSQTIYAGPGKVVMGTTAWEAEGQTGEVLFSVNQESAPFASALRGHQGEQQMDLTGTISGTPFGSWTLLPTFFPPSFGVKVGSTAAALAIGTQIHGAAGSPVTTVILTPDGRSYTALRSAVSKPPDINLGVGKPFFGAATVSCIGLASKRPSEAGFLYTVVESSATYPGAVNLGDDYQGGYWTGVWGTAAGFGGDNGGQPMEAEDGWTLSCEVSTTPVKSQGLTRAVLLNSVRFMVRGRLVGPTHTQIQSAILKEVGAEFGGAVDLVLTNGATSKTITLKGCSPKGVTHDFSGAKLGTGEVAFVNRMAFSSHLPTSLLEFSA